MFYIYGSNDGNSIMDIENSKLVVMFGNNLVEICMSGGGIIYFFEKVCEKLNVKMIVIDLWYIDMVVGCEDEWFFICLGIDVVLVVGIVWVLINENFVD